MRRRKTPDKPRAIIYPGTVVDVIGGVGWHVLTCLENQEAKLDGALEGMGIRLLPIINEVTAYKYPTRGTVLLGAACAEWNDWVEQIKSLFYSHDLRKNSVILDDISKRDSRT